MASGMASGVLHRLAAFTTTPGGGNPAGVWIGDTLPDPATMQRIATGVALGRCGSNGTYQLDTAIGTLPVDVRLPENHVTASLTSVQPRHARPPEELVSEALAALGWQFEELDPAIPPALAYA